MITASAAATAQVSLSLPATFAYVPGSTVLDGTSGPDPAPGAWAGALSWSLPISAGSNTLTFEAHAGVGLGSATASISVAVGANSSTSSASVDVVDGEAPSIYSQSSAVPLSAGQSPSTQGNLNIGYVAAPGQLNDWSVTVGTGQELSLALTNLPASYDLELFGPSTQQLQGTPTQTLPGVADTLPSLTPYATTEATPGSQDIPVTPRRATSSWRCRTTRAARTSTSRRRHWRRALTPSRSPGTTAPTARSLTCCVPTCSAEPQP